MKRLLLLLVVLVASVWLGLKMQLDSGYVLIAYGKWTLEMSIWFGLASLIFLAFVTYLLAKLLTKLIKVPKVLSHWKKRHRQLVARRLTKRGLIALAEGRWQRAEKQLSRGAKYSDMSLINFLAAAMAAQQQGAILTRDQYLQNAFATNPEAGIAISLTQAQLQLKGQQWEQALASLSGVLKQAPDNTHVYKLLLQVYLQLQDWDNVLTLLPQLRKYQLLQASELEQLETQAYCAKLRQAQTLDQNKVHQLWQKISRQLRRNPELIQCYAELLLQVNQHDEAAALLQDSIKRNWHEQLIRLYGLVKSNTVDKQLKIAEEWLNEHPHDPELLLCLGRLSLANQLWGKARSYFEASIAEQAKPETYLELAKLLEKLELREEAIGCYREGLLRLA